jgi:hypothetical protein
MAKDTEESKQMKKAPEKDTSTRLMDAGRDKE